MGYLGLKSRYEDLKASMAILKAQNIDYLKLTTDIDKHYDVAEISKFEEYDANVRKYETLLEKLPCDVWI